MVTKREALTLRKRTDHAQILASRAAKASAPPVSWWARKDLTWEQFTALADEADKRMNAVSTTQHVQRKMGDV